MANSNARYGLTLNQFQEALGYMEALPPADVESVVNPDEKANRRQRSNKLKANQEKYPSTLVQALGSMRGKAGFEVSSAVSSIFYKKMALTRMEEKKDHDIAEAANKAEEINEIESDAKQWLGMHEYLSDIYKKQIASEGLTREIYDIEPFPIDQVELKNHLNKIGESKQFNKILKKKESERDQIIDMIRGLTALPEWSDDKSFDSISALIPKLDDMADKQAELKHKYAESPKISMSAKVKMDSIELVANKLNDIVENAYELVIDKDDQVH